MFLRRLTQSFLVCLAFSLAASAQVNQGTGFLLHLPGAGSNANRFVGYLANVSDLGPDVDANGPTNADQVLVTPNGQRFYVVGDGPLQSIDAQLQTFSTLNAVAGPIKKAALTPDGKYLLVAGADFYIVNTETNTVAATNLGISGALVDFAISADSKKAWLLQSNNIVGTLTPLNLTNLTPGTRVDLAKTGSSLSISPLGQLYVTSGNNVAEINPDTLALVANIEVLAQPGPLRFTPDGSRAYFVNNNPTIGGRSILSFRTSQRDVTDWPPFNPDVVPPLYDEIFIASNDRIFALDKSKTTLWAIAPSPLTGVPTNLNGTIQADRVFAVAMSNEVPSARFLYVLVEEGNRAALKRISLANDTVSAESVTTLTSGVLRYVAVPPQSGAAQFIKFNDNQVLGQGGAAKPLAVRVTDGLGRPVFNQLVTFSADVNSGVTITTPDTISNSDGFVSTGVAVPTQPGIYTINVAAGSANTSFTITVPGAGGGTPGGPQRISVYRGDGQVVREFSGTREWVPLTAKVVDENGDPQPNVEVVFSVVEGTGQLLPNNTLTDENGLISTGFFAQNISFGKSFEANKVRAESAYGTADFVVTVIRVNQDNSGQPQTIVVQPTFNQVTVGKGDVIKDFFVVETKATNFPQNGVAIPNVGLRIADGFDLTQDGPGACVNNTLGDNLGVSRCDFKASCSIDGNVPIQVSIGEFRISPVFLIVTPGSAQQLKYLSGNGQSGTAGQQLPNLLTAQVTDNCGNGVAGKPVIWTIVSGSATLSQVVSTSGSDGRVSARVTLGQNPGQIVVRVAMEGVAPVVFNLTNNVIVSSIGLVSGGGQTATAGAQFANPVVFVVRDNNNNPVGANLTVNFSVSGPATINPVQGTTDSQGRVQTTVTAGSTSGAVTVTASYLGFTSSANLTVLPPGIPLTTSLFRNAASDAVGLVPCGLVTVAAPGLAPGVNGVVSGVSAFGPLPYTLANVSISVNGVPAPIQAVSNQNGKQQVNFQVPCETQPGTATVVVSVSGQNNTVTGVPVFAGQPGIFTYAGPNNKVYGAVIRLKDGSYITPSNLAPTGESFWMILTGMGQVTPALTTNSPGLPNQQQNVNLQTIVGVNNGGVPSQPARYLPGSIGVYYVEFTIPKIGTAAPGTVLLTDTPLAVAVVVNGQVVFGNPVLLPGVVQGQ